jgi:hypothetical protein
MARIHTYENDGVVRGNDKWIGSDAQSSNQTKNFTADKVAEYYSSVGTILFPNSVTLRYTEWQNPSGTPSGFIWIFEPSPDTVLFNSVTSFGLSKKDLKVRFFDQLISSFEGDYIYFYNSANPNCYSIYKLILVEDHPDNSNLLKIDVEFVRGNGFLSFNNSFLIGLLDMSVNYSDINGAPENLSEFNNDVGFITIDDLPAVSLNAIEFSVNHTDALNNEYKAGDVVYYEGRIYKAKFDNDAILPEIGGNTYWLDLGAGARVRQINADWDSTGGDSLILNKPTIPTQTSDLTNDGEDGVNPFISQEQVVEYADLASFPSIGTVGVIYIALDTDLAYVWDPGTMDYVLTSMPDTGITGVGKTNRIAKFSSPTNVTWSKISEDNFGSVKINDSNKNFLNGNTLLSIQRPQSQMDFVVGNPTILQSNVIVDDNTIGTEYRTKGAYSFKTGASYTESFVVGSDGKLKISQTPDTGDVSDSLLARDSSGNVKQVSYPDVSGFVPYTEATQDVDLGEFELKAGQVTLDTSPTGTASVGTTRWNDTIGSTETTLKGGNVILKNGVDLVARVVNKVTPNTTLTKATYPAVRVSGAQGQRLAVAYAQANNDNNSADTIGLVCETIATNQEGFIITVGQLEEINTTGSLQGETWTDGDVLYLSPTIPGAITNVKPSAPGHIVVIGYVEYAHAIHGSLYVKIMNGWELDELHNVAISSPTDNQVLAYTSSTQLWENKSVGTALGFTPENVTNKAINLTSPDNTKYPTTLAVSSALAGKANNATVTNISLTSTIVGWSTFTVREIFLLETDDAYLVIYRLAGTSNSASSSFTIPNNAGYYATELSRVQNNGTSLAQPGFAVINAGSNIVTLNINNTGGAWTASGGKFSVGQILILK